MVIRFTCQPHKTTRGRSRSRKASGSCSRPPARNLTPEMIQRFLDDLLKTLSPASVNHYRTIFNSSFNFAIKWKKYNDNPVAPIAQVPEREPRDRFVTVEELAALIGQCQEEGDLELQGFIILAACTDMRRRESMRRQLSDVGVDGE